MGIGQYLNQPVPVIGLVAGENTEGRCRVAGRGFRRNVMARNAPPFGDFPPLDRVAGMHGACPKQNGTGQRQRETSARRSSSF